MKIGSAQADRAHERELMKQADAHWAPPLPVCSSCGCTHKDHDSHLCESCKEEPI